MQRADLGRRRPRVSRLSSAKRDRRPSRTLADEDSVPKLPEDRLVASPVTKRGLRFPSDQLKLRIIIEEDKRAFLSIGTSARDAAALLFRSEYKPRGYLVVARTIPFTGY